MDQQVLNLIEVVKEAKKTEKKEEAIKFITSEFDILTHKCNTCKTNSIIYLESEAQVYCLYCDKHIPEFLYAECECGGQGIIEEVCDRDGVCGEIAICLKCGEEIPKDVCFHTGETGYNFPVAVIGVDKNGEDVYAPVSPDIYQTLYGGDLLKG